MKTLKEFILKTLAFALPPLACLAALYVCGDPFKVLRSPADFFADGLSVNKGVVTANTFERNNPSHHYDSFIVGSSIACYYRLDDWCRLLPPGAKPFHFDTSNQSVATMRRCIDFLAQNADSLGNVLIVLDPFILRLPEEQTSMVYLDPPQIRSEWYYPAHFHYKMMRHFMNAKYLLSYVPWLFTGDRHNYTDTPIFEPQPIVWGSNRNEEKIPAWDDSIASTPGQFYAGRAIMVSDADFHTAAKPLVIPAVEAHFRAIAAALAERGANYRLVMGPNLRHEVLCAEDDSLMREIFGKRFHNLGRDFLNETADRTNFYDNTHYRHTLSRRIMEKVYSPQPPAEPAGNYKKLITH